VRKTAIISASLIALALVLYFTGFTKGFMSGFEGHAGLPSCASSHGQSDVKRAFNDSPAAKTTGLAIVGMVNVKTSSADASKVECSATALLNSAQQGVVSYSFLPMGSGQYYVHAKIEPESIGPLSFAKSN
jgi:hypothetical protein